MHKVVFLRHGESEWNLANRFTGWTDVDLTERGEAEAVEAGRLLLADGYTFDVAFTSVLTRTIRTLWLVLDVMKLMWVPVHRSWRLNERHYGDLQGQSKDAVAKAVGEHQVWLWRRSFTVQPPPLPSKDDPRYPGHDPRYAVQPETEWPLTESLQDTQRRCLPYWVQAIVPAVREGRRVLVAAHGNSLRALVMHLDRISAEAVPALNIPTGIPLVYAFDGALQPTDRFYLGESQQARQATDELMRLVGTAGR